MQWFEFLIDPAVANRKVRAGNRTWPSASAQSILKSVIRTCDQLAIETLAFLSRILCGPSRRFFPHETVINY